MRAVSIKVYHFSKWVLVAFLICIALLTVVGRVVLGNLDYFKNEIAQELADYGIKGVKLENIEGQWQGLQPRLKIHGASINVPGRSNSLYVNELSLRVKLVPSLISGDLILESFNSSIEKLVLVRDLNGIWWLNDIPLSADSSDNTKLDIYGFFQRLPSFVNINIGLIQLRDLRHGLDYFIQNSVLRSSRKKQQLSLELVSQLPSSLGRNLQLVLTGDELNQQLLVKADRLNLVRLLQLTSVQKIELHRAVISLQSWINLKQFHFQQVITEAKVSQLILNNEKKNQQALNFSLVQKADAELNQWRINTDVKKIQKGQQKYADIKSQILLRQQGEKPLLWIDRVSLPFVLSILQDVLTDESLVKLLTDLKPVAALDNVVVEMDVVDPMHSIFGFNFSELNSVRVNSIPGLTGLSGSLVSTRGYSQLSINSTQASVDFGDLFRAPIELDKLKVNSFIQLENSMFYVNTDHFELANEDADIQGRLWLESAAKQRPFVALRASYSNGQVSAISKYLPVKIMHDEVVNWLDKSMLSGRIRQGDFLFHGRLQNPAVLVKNQSGVLHASLTASNPEINYLAGWPVVVQGKGQLDFFNTGMHADFENVKIADVTVDKVKLDIPDLLKANLFINGKTQSSAKKLLGTLSALPILNVFDEVKHKTQSISGPVYAELNIDIPLSNKLNKPLSVNATAELKNVTLSIPDWMIDLKTLNGIINIDNEKVNASALSGLYYGDQVRLDIKPDEITQRTQVTMTGDIHSQSLLTLVPEYLSKPVSGISPWDVTVSVGHNPDKNSPILNILASSTLQGTALSFPQPAQLAAQDQGVLKFSAKLFEKGGFPFNLTFAENLVADGFLDLLSDSETSLLWLNLALGEGKPVKTKSGINIVGNTGVIDMNDWFDYKNQYFPDNDDESTPFLKQLNSLTLEVKRLILGNQQALNSHLKIFNNGEFLQGYIDSDLTKGSFELPYQMGVMQPLKADLEYIKLKKSTTKEKFNVAIDEMPDLYVTSKAVSYEKMEFTDLILSCRKEANKFVVEQLDFSRDKVHLKSSGSWQYEAKSRDHVSVFNIGIKGDNFGQTVNNLGLGETIAGSTVDFNGQVGWGGELYNINWPTLIGEVDLLLEEGYLKNVDPGAGRFVGLLSFNALPKRLFLDFGDVVSEGMQFNKINGKFSIKGEILQTDNASLDSVSAKVKINGVTNLRHQTYDQTMIITPKIGDTLPLLGTLAAGNAVGWGLLLLQKIFKKPIDKSVEIEYKVTGSWENPEVKLVPKPKVKQNTDLFYNADF